MVEFYISLLRQFDLHWNLISCLTWVEKVSYDSKRSFNLSKRHLLIELIRLKIAIDLETCGIHLNDQHNIYFRFYREEFCNWNLFFSHQIMTEKVEAQKKLKNRSVNFLMKIKNWMKFWNNLKYVQYQNQGKTSTDQ